MKNQYFYLHNFRTVVILFFTLLYSCSGEVNKKNGTIDNDYKNFKIDVDNISDSCDNVIKYAEFIPLEFSDQAILNEITKLIHRDEKFIIFDKRQRQVVVFDKFGNFYSRIEKYGKGPNEYLFPTDIIFDENGIGILAQCKGAIIWVTPEGDALANNYISRDKLILSQASIWDNQIYHFVHNSKIGRNPFQLNSTDMNLSKIKFSMFKSNSDQISNLHIHPFGVYNNSLTLHLPNDQSLYKIDQNKVSKLFGFDFGDKNLPKKLLRKILLLSNNTTQSQILDYNKELLPFVSVEKIIPLQSFIFLEISYKFQRFHVLVNVNENNSYVFRNNLGRFSFGEYIGCDPRENIVYFEISPAQINKYKSSRIKNAEIVKKNYNEDILNNNPWILKLQF